jgi:hypothetical protein
MPIFFVFFFITIAIVVLGPAKKPALSVRRVIVLAAVYLCVIYFGVQGLLLSNARQTVINSVVFISMVVPCLVLILSLYQEIVLKIFVNFHVILSVSAIATFVVFVLVGFSVYRIPVIADLYSLVEYAEYDPSRPLSNHQLLFPITVAWSVLDIVGVSLPRAVGIYREPGMAQIFFLTAVMLTYFLEMKNVGRKRVLLLIGTALLFSAAGFVNFVICILVLSTVKASVKQSLVRFIKNPLVVVFSLVLFIFIARETYFLVANKLENVSGSERLESFARGIGKLSENPVFGKGYYNAFKTYVGGAEITENVIGLPGVSAELGLVGLGLYCLCWLLSIRLLSGKRALCIYIPVFLTLALSQPSYNDAFAWFVMFLDTRHFTFNS